MHEDGQKLLELMFKQEETVCVSNSKFSYHSIPLENALQGTVTLLPPLKNDKTWEEQAIYCDSSELLLVALNPIEGYCRDNNVKSYRNFLIELDIGTIDEQIEYIKRSGLCYSAMIFSGGKSAHTLISLDQDLPDSTMYRKIIEWIMNILTLADKACKNPSRKIRIPGAERTPGKFQELLEFKGKVKLEDLSNWLQKHPNSMPKDPKKRLPFTGVPDLSRMKPWSIKMLEKGFPAGMGRNSGWFILSCDAFDCGFNEDQIIELFRPYFTEESDFNEREWLSTINSAFKSKYQK